jgi:hypothetical protein
MADNFRVTAERMRYSSKLLHENNHFHNACYLAGYVCECYLKVIVENAPNLKSPKAYKHNITDLIYAITSASTIPAQFRPFLINYAVDCATITSSWSPNSRYDDTSGWDQNKSNQFQLEMEKCFDKVAEMYISSLIL